MNVVHSNNYFSDDGFAAGLTRYLGLFPGMCLYGSNTPFARVQIQSAGTLSYFGVRWSSDTLSSTATFRTVVNGSNGNSVVTVAAGASAGYEEDTSNTDSLDDGEDWEAKLVTAAGTGTIYPTVLTHTFAPTSGTSYYACHTGEFGSAVDTPFGFGYNSGGYISGLKTDANMQQTVGASFTLQNLYASCDRQYRSGSVSLRSRVNGANGNLVVSFASGVTGEAEDTSNTDAVVAGDHVCFYYDESDGSTNTFRVQCVKMEFSGTDCFPLFAAHDPESVRIATFDTDATYYVPVSGSCGGSWQLTVVSTTASHIQTRCHVPFTWSDLYIYVSSVNGSYPVASYVNSAAGNMALTINGVGEFSDLTNTDTIADNDDICLRVDGTGAGTSGLLIRTISSLGSAISGVTYHMTGALTTEKQAGGNGQTFTAGITPAGALAKSLARVITAAVASAGALSKRLAGSYLSGATPTGVLVKKPGKTIPGNVTSTGIVTKQTGKSILGGVTPTGVLTRLWGRPLAAGLASAGILTKRIGKVIAGAISTIIGILDYAKQGQQTQTLSGGVTPSGILAKRTSKGITASITPTGTVAKSLGRVMAGSVATLTGVLTASKTRFQTFGGGNLVKNWNCSSGDNTNFGGWPYDAVNTHNGHGTIKMASYYASMLTDGWWPVDASGNTTYIISVYLKSTTYVPGQALAYLGVACYDVDGLVVENRMVTWFNGTATTLAAPLNPGDNTITLTDAVNWPNGAGLAGYQRMATIFGYRNTEGHLYPDFTYSRYNGFDVGYTEDYGTVDQGGMWLPGGISGNVITLRKPWPAAGGSHPSGRGIVRSGASGYSYPWIGQVDDNWNYHEGSISGVFTDGNEVYNKFRPGTAFMRPVILANYYVGSGNVTNFSELNVKTAGPLLVPYSRVQRSLSRVVGVGGLTPIGAVAKQSGKSLVGTLSTIGTRAASLGHGFVGTLSSAGVRTVKISQTLAGSLASSGIRTVRLGRSWAGSVTATGILGQIKTKLQAMVGSLTPTGTVSPRVLKPLVGAVTTTGLLDKRASKTMIGGFTPTGILVRVKAILKPLAATLTLAGVFTRKLFKLQSGTVSTTATLDRVAKKSFVGGTTPTGLLTRVAIHVSNLVANVSPTGIFTRKVGKSLIGQATSNGAISKRSMLSVFGSVTATATVLSVRVVHRAWSGVVTWVGDLVGIWTPPDRKKLGLRGIMAQQATTTACLTSSTLLITSASQPAFLYTVEPVFHISGVTATQPTLKSVGVL